MKSTKDTTEEVVVEVVLGRRLTGAILTIYMPTIPLIMISFLTNYLKPIYFETMISVNLTVKNIIERVKYNVF